MKSLEWRVHLEDMLTGCQKVHNYTSGIETIQDFVSDEMRYDATLRNLQNIGESAGKVPEVVQAQLPSIDWRGITGVRNVLVHGYTVINHTTIWEIIQHKVPELERELKAFLATQT